MSKDHRTPNEVHFILSHNITILDSLLDLLGVEVIKLNAFSFCSTKCSIELLNGRSQGLTSFMSIT